MAIVCITNDDGVPQSHLHLDRYDLDTEAKVEGWQKWFIDSVKVVILAEDREATQEENGP